MKYLLTMTLAILSSNTALMAQSTDTSHQQDAAVKFDATGHATRDGHPAFPIGIYAALAPGAVETPAKVEDLARSDFDFFINYAGSGTPEEMQKYHDLLSSHGLVEFYPLEKIYKDIGHAGWQLDFPETEQELIQQHVKKAMAYPSVAGWYIQDELPLNAPVVRQHHDWIKEVDPSRPTLVVTSQREEKMYDLFAPTGDIFAFDCYPVPVRGGTNVIGRLVNKFANAGERTQPKWFVAQAFGDYVYFDEVRSGKGPGVRPRKLRTELRAPTSAEMRVMCFQAITNGATGLVIYYYTDINLSIDRDTRWPAVKQIVSDVHAIEPLLVADPWKHRSLQCDNSAFSWKAVEKDGKTYIIAVNTSRDYQNALFSRFPGNNIKKATVIQGDGFAYAATTDGKSQLQLALDGFETIVVELE